MSSSNEQRSYAEALFNVCKQSDPDALCLRLAALLQVCAQPDTRAMAAILLRRLLTRDDSFVWPRLNVSTHSSIKSVPLNQIQVETAQSLSKKLCDTVSELASSILPENGWPELLPFMFQCIAEAESLEEGILHLAIEFVVTFAEARERAPGMTRKLPQFISRLFAILLRLLLDIEDDAAWHTAEVEDEDAGENSNYAVGQEYLDRLAISLGGNTIVPVASEQFSTYLAALEWQKHHAALIALAQIAVGLFQGPCCFSCAQLQYNMQNGKQMVQEGALTALASVADSCQMAQFDNMGVCRSISKNTMMEYALPESYLVFVGMAVGKEKLRDDAKQACARLCKCLAQDFLPYSAQLKPDVTITSADSDKDIEDSDDESMETITLGDKRIGIKTSVLEEKATACNMLCCYADELKEGFFFLGLISNVILAKRWTYGAAMLELLRSAKLAVEKGMAQGRNETYVKRLSDYIIPALVEALHEEPDTEI
ncbi:hypothetical protein GOBAR_AA20918 [Gossypium barbadense]|uniref:Importin N-terminal domain-containing protein n=1 Tax=Gossypium barbadense TaxID=3634 RepID=A0A2P5X8U2_GOSBA|nr:hypothetical protein GOBAR_AA20918 [Gossypium barbadense]